MIVAERRQADLTVVEIEGTRLDAAVAEAFKADMKRLIDKGERHIVVDFSNVQFMDSSGLGALVGCLKHMGAGGAIDIARPSGTVMKVLRLTRMNKVFTVRDDLPAG